MADPPWEMGKIGVGKDKRPGRNYKCGDSIHLSYPTMPIDEICKLNVIDFADNDCHLWVWTTNKTLRDTFKVIDSWGFKYLNTITYNKPTGVGPWFVNTTQHLLFAYRGKLKMGCGRYALTSQFYTPKKHSKKPIESYNLIESISFPPRLELFARPISPMFNKREGWDVWGNEVESDVILGG